MDKLEHDKIVLQARETAAFFGVTMKTLADWVKKGCPREKQGKYNLYKVYAWKNQAVIINEDGEAQALSLEAQKLKAEIEWKEKKAAQEAIKLAELEGKYFPKEEVEQEWAKRIIELKQGLLAWARTLPPELAGQDLRRIEKVLMDEVYELLETYARDGTYTPKQKKGKGRVVK